MTGRAGWGMFALLVAIIALAFLPSEHTKMEKAVSQFDMGAPTMLVIVPRVIHIQKDSPPNAQTDVPTWMYTRQAPALWKVDIAYATCLLVSLPVQVDHRANQVSTARETQNALTGLHAPRNQVLLFWKYSHRNRLV